MNRYAAIKALEEGRAQLDAAGWTDAGEHRGPNYWFVCGKRGDRMNISLEWSERWDATITIGAHELAHQWSDTDPAGLIERVTQVARSILTAQIAAM